MLEASVRHGVERFVNISTDKAVDPCCVLGYSKRICERLTAAAGASSADGTYLSVRFGNVLGSRGSVFHTFKAQIGCKGPVTVTDPEVRRYFMTVEEAIQLVIHAGAVGASGEALVLDMGEPVLIAEVARRMIAEADQAIDVVYTGLRQGEKLNEVLFNARRAGPAALPPADLPRRGAAASSRTHPFARSRSRLRRSSCRRFASCAVRTALRSGDTPDVLGLSFDTGIAAWLLQRLPGTGPLRSTRTSDGHPARRCGQHRRSSDHDDVWSCSACSSATPVNGTAMLTRPLSRPAPPGDLSRALLCTNSTTTSVTMTVTRTTRRQPPRATLSSCATWHPRTSRSASHPIPAIQSSPHGWTTTC